MDRYNVTEVRRKMNKTPTIVKIYFAKSYLKPYTEHYIECISTRIHGKAGRLRQKGYDIIKFEDTGIEY